MDQSPRSSFGTDSETTIRELLNPLKSRFKSGQAENETDIFEKLYPEIKSLPYVQKIYVYSPEQNNASARVENVLNDTATSLLLSRDQLPEEVGNLSHYDKKNMEHEATLRAVRKAYPHLDEDKIDIIAASLRPHKVYCLVEDEPEKEDEELERTLPNPHHHSPVERMTPPLAPLCRPATPPIITPDVKKDILKGAICYVDCGDLREYQNGLIGELESCGARVNKILDKTVTHVFFLRGADYDTFYKALKLQKPLVTLLWLEECKKQRRMVEVDDFQPPNIDEYQLKRLRRRRRSIFKSRLSL